MAKLGKILVVEDDPHAREGFSDLLNAWGYETETAGDGAVALEKITTFNPAVVISDLRMPQRSSPKATMGKKRVSNCSSFKVTA